MTDNYIGSPEQQDRVTRQTALSNLILVAADLMAHTAQQCATDNVARLGAAQSMALGVVLLSAFHKDGYGVNVRAIDGMVFVAGAQPDEVTRTILLSLGWVAPSSNIEVDGLYHHAWQFYL